MHQAIKQLLNGADERNINKRHLLTRIIFAETNVASALKHGGRRYVAGVKRDASYKERWRVSAPLMRAGVARGGDGG